jgi:hypothetical protein
LDQADGGERVEAVLDAAESGDSVFALHGDDDGVHVDFSRGQDLVFCRRVNGVSDSFGHAV